MGLGLSWGLWWKMEKDDLLEGIVWLFILWKNTQGNVFVVFFEQFFSGRVQER